jgi:competence protein ComEC
VERVGDPPWAAALAARVRRAVEQAHAAAAAAAGRDAATGPGLGLVRALVLADAGAVPEGWRRGLRRSGLAHLLAVSGLHVGLVAATALLLAAPLPWRGRLLVGLAAVAGYLLLAGPRPALLRAALMALLAVVALLGERTPSAPNALAVAVALLVLQRPALVTDLGFRLTATATAGIVLLGPCLERGWRRRGREGRAPSGWPGGRAAEAVVRALAATVAAQLASLPVAAPSFHLVSLTAPLGNLVAVPWTALTLAAGLGWSLLALLDPRPAAACLPLLDLLAAPFGWPAAGSPAAWGTVPAVAPVVASSLLAAAVAAWAARPLRRAALLLVAAALLPAWRWGDGGPRAHGGIELVIFDVGQGDAILLRDGDGAVLVDGGGWPRGDLGGRVLLPALAHEGVTELRAVVLTHGDRDHCGGLVDLASYMSLGEVWLGAGQPPGEGCATELTAAAATQGARVRRVAAGDRARLGRWRIRVLHPPAGERPARDNDASLVLLAEARGRRVLLAGDLEARGEGALVGRWGDGLRAEVLKVAHHGSGGSSGAGFLAAVGARLALVSAGAGNPYGHPAPAALARLSRGRSAVLRTDRDGCLHLAWGQGAGAGPAPLRVGVARPP